MLYLFTIYGTIESVMLRGHDLNVRKTVYDMLDPLLIIHDEIKKLDHFGHALQNPYSQLVSYRLMIIETTNNFGTGIYTWIETPVVGKTRSILNAHFEKLDCVLRVLLDSRMSRIIFYKLL